MLYGYSCEGKKWRRKTNTLIFQIPCKNGGKSPDGRYGVFYNQYAFIFVQPFLRYKRTLVLVDEEEEQEVQPERGSRAIVMYAA